jgi:endonuclease YncB( thermonuclease family)
MRSGFYRMGDIVVGFALVALLACAFVAGRHYPAGIPPVNETAALRPDAAKPDAFASADASLSVGTYHATVLRVVDGDTVEARVSVWPGHEVLTKIRLRGIDAPEIKGACGPEIRQAEAARDRLAALIGTRAVLLTEIGPDKYHGRMVARLLTAGADRPVDAGAVLVAEKLARPYGGKRRESWCVLAGG